MIRLTVPSLGEEEIRAVRDVLASGFLVQGPRVADFERAVARRVGVRHAVAVSSGTSALHLALLALGVGPGDLVVTTAYSWPATANVVELCGARPIFADIDAGTFNMDPEALGRVLDRLMADPATAGRVKAVLPVHAFGQLADMPAILEAAGRHGLPVVEDAACALGATLHGREAGTWGVIGCFSFHPRKAITTGEGGVITTDDPALARTMRALRNHGQDPDAATPDFIMPGFNYRLTEMQAAMGTAQMAKLDGIIAARRRLAAGYDALLAGTGVAPPAVAPGGGPVYQSYVALLPFADAARRRDLIGSLRARGVEANIGTWHVPMTTYYRERYGYRPGDFPVADDVFARAMTLPLYAGLDAGELAGVAHELISVVGI